MVCSDPVIDQEHLVQNLSEELDISRVLAGILVKRNLSDVKARSFLYPRSLFILAVIHTRDDGSSKPIEGG